MQFWKTSREYLKRMAEREEKIRRIREMENEWYNLTDFGGETAYSLMVEWVKELVENTSAKGLLVGVSGGVDSSLALLIAKESVGDKCFAMILPCGKKGEAPDDAEKLIKLLNVEYKIIDVEPVAELFFQTMGGEKNIQIRGNYLSRLRNALLYFEANRKNYLVMGTGDLDESYIGYSCKGTTSDLFPMNALHKEEVREHLRRELSRYDEKFAEYMAGKISTPGYTPNQSAEDELGISYDKIGKALDIILEQCEIWRTGILPNNIPVFEESITNMQLSPEEMLKVEAMIIKNYHKAFGSPVLHRSR